ncbi:rhamnogalacturonan acetylesterase [Streptomyces sp. NPDC003832]
MSARSTIRRPVRLAALATATAGLATLLVAPAHAAAHATVRAGGLPYTCAGTAPVTCHLDVPPGNYHVTVELGGDAAASTGVSAESRRTMVAETPTDAGQRVRRGFTVNVREPEAEPTRDYGTPGLTLRFEGAAPLLSGLRVTPAPRVPQVLLIGDSTVCDQHLAPMTGWGQELPQFLRRGTAVANYGDGGESTGSYLADPLLLATVEQRIRRGDLVLVQLAHNDKDTPGDTYRANLKAIAERVLAQGGQPVLVTPVVRRRFASDGTLDPIALHVRASDMPAGMRTVAQETGLPLVDLTELTRQLVEGLGPAGSKPLYLTNYTGDNIHTSPLGARLFAGLLAEDLRAQGLVEERYFR